MLGITSAAEVINLTKTQEAEAQEYANEHCSCSVCHDGKKFRIVDSGDMRHGLKLVAHFFKEIDE